MSGLGQTTLSGVVERTTDHAVLFLIDGAEQSVWVPRSVCLDGDAVEKDDTDLIVADWWLKKEGVIL